MYNESNTGNLRWTCIKVRNYNKQDSTHVEPIGLHDKYSELSLVDIIVRLTNLTAGIHVLNIVHFMVKIHFNFNNYLWLDSNLPKPNITVHVYPNNNYRDHACVGAPGVEYFMYNNLLLISSCF